jgi:hypothetical protein
MDSTFGVWNSDLRFIEVINKGFPDPGPVWSQIQFEAYGIEISGVFFEFSIGHPIGADGTENIDWIGLP